MNYSKITTFAIGLFMSLIAMAQTTSKAYIEPVEITPGETAEIKIMLDNPDDVVIGMQCDVKLPDGFDFVLDEGDVDASVGTRNSKHQISSEIQSDGSCRFVLTNGNNRTFKNTSGCVMTVNVKVSNSLAAGVYVLVLKNISLSDDQSRDIPLSNSYCSLTNGAIGDAQITALNSNLGSVEDITTIDLSDATVNSTVAIATGNPNTMVYLKEGSSVGNTKNVVVGTTCANLEITDGKAFAALKGFTATTASYSRTLPTGYVWGTICLPYEVNSDVNIQYYELKEVGTNSMTFQPLTTVAAGTPAVFKLLSGSKANMEAENVTISAGGSNVNGNLPAEGWTMKGTLEAITVTPTTGTDIYYIANDKFWYANQSFPVPAFRAWFETPTSSGAKARSLSILIDGEDASNINFVENEDGTVKAVFDISGKQLNAPQSSKVNIINGKKVMVR